MSWFWGSKPATPTAAPEPAAAQVVAPAPVSAQKPQPSAAAGSGSSWYKPWSWGGKPKEGSPNLAAVAANATEDVTSLIDPFFQKFAPTGAGFKPMKLSESTAMGIFAVVSIADMIASVGSWTRFLLTTAYTIVAMFAASWFVRYDKSIYTWLLIIAALVITIINGNAFINRYFKK